MASTPAPAAPTFRERWRRMMRPPRRLTFTRAGKFFMLMTLGVGLGALNTGNNLLFLLLGMMLSAIIASGILSEAVIRKTRAERRLPRRVFAGRTAAGSFTLRNNKPQIALNLEVSEHQPKALSGPMAGEEISSPDAPFWKFWVSDDFTDARYVAIGRAPMMDATSRMDLPARYLFPKRGRFHLPMLRIATRFPFGFFHKVLERDAPAEITVFPEPHDAEDWVGEVAAKFGDIARNRAGAGDEYFGLRDWREGEDFRQVHWKRTARRGELVVREFEEEEQRSVQVVFLLNSGQRADPPPQTLEDFEAGLSKTVGLLQALIDKRFRVGLTVGDALVPPGIGPGHLDRMLFELAEVELEAGTPAPPRLPDVGPRAQVAIVGIGLERALQASGGAYDMTLALEELEP